MDNIQSILDLLSKYIQIKQCKNNKVVYISKECPFCGEIGKRVFRYNTKLKVGKFFCCGRSFKEKYWLEKQLEDKDFADKFQLENRHGIYQIMDDEIYDYLYKDKMGMNNNSFVKSDEEDLPF